MAAVDLDLRRPAAEWRESWEARTLIFATLVSDVAAPRDKIGMCILSILAHSLPIEKMQFLLRACGFRGTHVPMLVSAAKIAKTGHVMADLITRDQILFKNQALFRDTRQMEGAFRRFADCCRLTDIERIEFFDAIHSWVVCDYRLDPAMDRRDPDAKRLTVH